MAAALVLGLIWNAGLLFISLCGAIAILNEMELPRLRYFDDAPRFVAVALVLLTLLIFAGLRSLLGLDGAFLLAPAA